MSAASAQNSAPSSGGDLLRASSRGDLDAVRRLLADGAPVDARDASGRTALLLATIGNHVEVARALIVANADVNAQDNQRDSAFLYAGAEGRLEILKLTIAAGADLASTNRYGGTALIPAAHHGHVETVRFLLTTPIDRDHVNRLGWTALLEAIILGDGGAVHTEIVKLLVDGGANVNIADRDGVTPLAHARRHRYAPIVRILEAEGAR
ncbi:MAG: ankyrin repeat domain-containing protein [Variibacter sp.]